MDGRAPKIALAQPLLMFSDDFHDGWKWGFETLGCDVRVFDIGSIKHSALSRRSPYAVPASARQGKQAALEVYKWEPDLVFCHHGRAAANETFQHELKRRGIPTATYLCDEPYECGETLQYSARFDYVFTMDPGTLAAHKTAKGRRDQVYYLPPGVNTDRFPLVPYSKREFKSRAFFLGNASLKPRTEWMKPVEKCVEGTDIRYWPSTNKRAHKQRWVGLDQHAELFSSCALGLNVHRDPRIGKTEYRDLVVKKANKYPKWPGLQVMQSPPPEWGGTGFWNVYDLPAQHINPRFFEMASCGTCVINDNHRNELERLFPMAPRAESPEHFLELVLYYLDHIEEAAEIGEECSYLISKQHTYRHRAAEIFHRVGLKASTADSLFGSLGAPEEWLTIQDFDEQGVNRSSGPIGLYGPYDRRIGRSLIPPSGKKSAADSLRMAPPWSC